MLYLVKIGKPTRRSGFQELHSFPVETQASRDDTIDYYKNKYGCTYIRKLYVNSYVFLKHIGEGKKI